MNSLKLKAFRLTQHEPNVSLLYALAHVDPGTRVFMNLKTIGKEFLSSQNMMHLPLQLTHNNHNTDIFPQFEGGDFSHLPRFFSMIKSKVKEFQLDSCPGLLDSNAN